MATVSIQADKFIGTVAASQMIGCTESYIRQLLRKDVISGIKVGPRAWVVEKKSVAKFAKTKPKYGRPRGSKNNSEK